MSASATEYYSDSACLKGTRILLHFLNTIIVLMGVAIVALVVVFFNDTDGIADTNFVNLSAEMQAREILRHCTVCQQSVAWVLGAFALVVVTALFGFAGLCSRNRCLLISYAVLSLSVVGTMSFATTGLVLIDQGAYDSSLSDDWNSIEPTGKCQMETAFQCSGWDNICPLFYTNDTSDNSNITFYNDSDIPAGCADCGFLTDIELVFYDQTCHQQFSSAYNQYAFEPVVSATSALMALGAVAAIVSMKMRANSLRLHTDEVALLNTQYSGAVVGKVVPEYGI